MCAAWKGQTDAGRTLLRYGADIHVVDMEMKTCLHWAVELQHLEFAKMLFEHGHGGEDLLNMKDRREQTALHYAAGVGNVQVGLCNNWLHSSDILGPSSARILRCQMYVEVNIVQCMRR